MTGKNVHRSFYVAAAVACLNKITSGVRLNRETVETNCYKNNNAIKRYLDEMTLADA